MVALQGPLGSAQAATVKMLEVARRARGRPSAAARKGAAMSGRMGWYRPVAAFTVMEARAEAVEEVTSAPPLERRRSGAQLAACGAAALRMNVAGRGL